MNNAEPTAQRPPPTEAAAEEEEQAERESVESLKEPDDGERADDHHVTDTDAALLLDDDDDDEEEEDEAEEEEEEIRLDGYVLPPLPPATAPPTVYDVRTDEVYSVIEELRRRMDDPVERETAKETLKDDPKVLMAVAQVLQESRLLRRPVVNEQTGQVEERLVPQPEAPLPQLPAGYKSWVIEETKARGGRYKRYRR